jgi:hypothetical protein
VGTLVLPFVATLPPSGWPRIPRISEIPYSSHVASLAVGQAARHVDEQRGLDVQGLAGGREGGLVGVAGALQVVQAVQFQVGLGVESRLGTAPWITWKWDESVVRLSSKKRWMMPLAGVDRCRAARWH